MIKDKLLFMRTQLGYTQQDIARLTGIHLATYKKYEAGEVLPGFGFLQELAGKLQINLNWLAGQGNEMVSKTSSLERLTGILTKLDDLDLAFLETLQEHSFSREDKAVLYGKVKKELLKV